MLAKASPSMDAYILHWTKQAQKLLIHD